MAAGIGSTEIKMVMAGKTTSGSRTTNGRRHGEWRQYRMKYQAAWAWVGVDN